MWSALTNATLSGPPDTATSTDTFVQASVGQAVCSCSVNGSDERMCEAGSIWEGDVTVGGWSLAAESNFVKLAHRRFRYLPRYLRHPTTVTSQRLLVLAIIDTRESGMRESHHTRTSFRSLLTRNIVLHNSTYTSGTAGSVIGSTESTLHLVLGSLLQLLCRLLPVSMDTLSALPTSRSRFRPFEPISVSFWGFRHWLLHSLVRVPVATAYIELGNGNARCSLVHSPNRKT